MCPTDTLYGLAASIYSPSAIQRVFEIKGRPLNQGIPVLINSVAQIDKLALHIPSSAIALAEAFWPGPLTLIFHRVQSLLPELSGGLMTIAVRYPNHPTPCELIESSGAPITGTSANLSGGNQPITPEEVVKQIGDKVDILLDAGPSPHAEPSTIVDTTQNPFRLLRFGALPLKALREVTAIEEIK